MNKINYKGGKPKRHRHGTGTAPSRTASSGTSPSGTAQQQGQKNNFHGNKDLYQELNIDEFKSLGLKIVNIPESKYSLLYSLFYASNRKDFKRKTMNDRITYITNERNGNLLTKYKEKYDKFKHLKLHNEQDSALNDEEKKNKNIEYIKDTNNFIGNKFISLFADIYDINIIVINLNNKGGKHIIFKNPDNSITDTIILVNDKIEKSSYKCLIDKDNKTIFAYDSDIVKKVITFLEKYKNLVDDSIVHTKVVNTSASGTQGTQGAQSAKQQGTNHSGLLPPVGPGQRSSGFKRGDYTFTTIGPNTNAGREHDEYLHRMHLDINSNGYGRRSRNYGAQRGKKNSQVLLLFLVPIMLIFLLFVLSKQQ